MKILTWSLSIFRGLGPVKKMDLKLILAMIRIDKMVDTTRQMMQKYLQDTLVRDLEIQLNQAK